MRIRSLKKFTVFFVIVVVLACYGLALLRTYVFKPPAPPAKAAAIFLLVPRLLPGNACLAGSRPLLVSLTERARQRLC